MNSLTAKHPRRTSKTSKALALRNGFDALSFIRGELQDKTQERLVIVNLDEAGKVIGFEVVSAGQKKVHETRPVEVFSSSVHAEASAAIVVHHYPTRVRQPSLADVAYAEKILRAAEFIEITMADFIITGIDGRYSFAEESELAGQFG